MKSAEGSLVRHCFANKYDVEHSSPKMYRSHKTLPLRSEMSPPKRRRSFLPGPEARTLRPALDKLPEGGDPSIFHRDFSILRFKIPMTMEKNP